MTKEEKQLLLKDLCARLSYDPLIKIGENPNVFKLSQRVRWIYSYGEVENMFDDVKPYLRPMSSMTEEEEAELMKLGVCECAFHNDIYDVGTCVDEAFTALSWLFGRHFDVNGLIEKGLAIEVTEENNPYSK